MSITHDIAVGANIILPTGASQLKKPPYLLVFKEGTGKSATFSYFISLDKPETMNGLINVKGIFTEYTKEEIVKNYVDILTNISKDQIEELMIPIQRIHLIKSLVFSANKSAAQQR